MESIGMDLQQNSASGGPHQQPREPSGPVADKSIPTSSSHAAMSSASGPDRHGLTPHPPALQHPGQPSHTHRPRHVQLISPRANDEPHAVRNPRDTPKPQDCHIYNTPQAQPSEHDDQRPTPPTEATANMPPAPDASASALSTAAAANASRPTTVSQAWLSRHNIHSNAIRSRLEHQRQHHDPHANTHRRAGVSHHGKSADEWRPYELQRALSKAATQLPERTKLGDQVISKVLALTRWKTKAREKAESRPVSMHARTPWLQQLQQLTRRRNGVIGSGLEHDGAEPLVAFMLQDSQAEQDLRLQLAEEMQQQELTPMEAIQERVEAAVEGVRRWHAEQRAARRAASAAASRAQGRSGTARSKGRTSPGIPLLVPRPPGSRPGASEPGAADGGGGQGVGGDGGAGEGMGTAEEAGGELGVEAVEGELGEGEYYDEFGDEDDDFGEEDDYDPWNDGELHEDEEEDGEEGEEEEDGDFGGQEGGCGEVQQGADGGKPELGEPLAEAGAAAGADAVADGEGPAQADGASEQEAAAADAVSGMGTGGGRGALEAMSGVIRRALKSRNARSSRDNDWGFILQQMPCLTRRENRQQLLDRYQSKRMNAAAAVAAHNAEGLGAEWTPRMGTPSRATPPVPRTPGGGRVLTAGLDGLSPAGPTPRAGHEEPPRRHRLSHSRGSRAGAGSRGLPRSARGGAESSQGHGGLDGEEDDGSWEEEGEDSWTEDGSSSSSEGQQQGSGESRQGEVSGDDLENVEEGLKGEGGEGGTSAHPRRRRRLRRQGRRRGGKHGQEGTGGDATGAGTAEGSLDEGEDGDSSGEEEGDQEDGGEVSDEQQGDGGGKEGRSRRRARRRRRRKRHSQSRGKSAAEGPPSPRKACSMPAILPGSLPLPTADNQQHTQLLEGSVPLPSFRSGNLDRGSSTAGDSSPFTHPANRHLRLSQGSRPPSGLASAPELSPSGSSNTSPVTAIGGSGSRGNRLFGASGGKASRLPGVAWPGSGQATGHPQCRPQQRPWAFLPIMHESFPAGPLVRQARASYPDDSLIPLDQFLAQRHAAAASTGSGGALSPVAHVHEERVDEPRAAAGQGAGAGTTAGRRPRRASMYAGAVGSGRCKGDVLPNLLPEHVPLRPVDPDTVQRNRLLRPPRDSQSGAPLASQCSQLSLMQSLDSLKQNSCPHLGARVLPAASTSCNAPLPPLTRGEGPCGAGSLSPVPPPPPHPTPVPPYSVHAQLQAQAQRQHALAAAQAQGLGQEVSFSQLFPHADRETSFTVLPGLRVSHQVPVQGMSAGSLQGVGCSVSSQAFGGGACLGLGLGLGMGQASTNGLPALGKKAMPKGGGFRYA